MPTGYEFTVGATPITVFRQRGCGLARMAGRLVAVLPGVAVLSGCGASPCLAAIRRIKRWLSLGGLSLLEEAPGLPPSAWFLVATDGAAAVMGWKDRGGKREPGSNGRGCWR